MKLIVTGGAGFIGSNFIYYLLKHYPNDEIICLDVLTYAGNMETLEHVFGNTISANRGKPTNSEFMALLTDKLRLEYRMREAC